MRVLIINPTLAGESFSQHVGITAVASFINARTSHRAELMDFGFHRLRWRDYLDRRVREFQPDAFGVNVASPIVAASRTMIDALRPYGKPIVAGGTHCTILPRQSFEELECDAVCIGEGEFTLAEYLDRLEADEPLDGLAGLWFRRNGEIVENPPRPVTPDIDDLPDDDWTLWEDIDLHLEAYGMISFYGTRGCPHECSYCTSTTLRQVLPGNFRLCDPELYVARIARAWERFGPRGMKIAWLWDQVFTRDTDWLRRFHDEYRRRGLHRCLPYSVYVRGDELDEERARLLADSGGVFIRVGFESGDDWMRCEVYRKRISRDSYRETVRLAHKYGISVTGYFILGGPGETWRSMRNTYRLAAELKVDIPTFYVYKPLPRTAAVRKLKELGGSFTDAWKRKVLDIRFGGMVYTPHLSPRQVEFFQMVCALRFLPGVLWNQMLKLGLRYFPRFFRFARRARRHGIGLMDSYRHFTYTAAIGLAIDRWRRRMEAADPGPDTEAGATGGPPEIAGAGGDC